MAGQATKQGQATRGKTALVKRQLQTAETKRTEDKQSWDHGKETEGIELFAMVMAKASVVAAT